MKLYKQTKEDKERAKINGQIFNWLYKDVDWELKRKLNKLQEYENKVNPLGLWRVFWDKSKSQ